MWVGSDVVWLPTVGALIDRMNELVRLLESPLVSFAEIDLVTRTAATSFRPYLPGHSVAVDGVNEMLDEHSVFIWCYSQAATRTSAPVPALTRREHGILKFLAAGPTADAIGRQLRCMLRLSVSTCRTYMPGCKPTIV